jgi:AraC-like DNA-binding protein
MISYLRDASLLAKSSRSEGRNLRIMDYLKRNYNRPITLSDLSNLTGLHPQYLCHQFSVEMGIPPMAALTRHRVQVAKKLLINTRLPISEIAARVGCEDVYSFSKRFKMIEGLSPLNWRKKHSS